MASWLETYPPRRFSDLALDASTLETIERVALQANPPHLLISGPAGSGKTATWNLIVRQVLGPSWRSTTHVLQAKDLAKSAGAMAAFESFSFFKCEKNRRVFLAWPKILKFTKNQNFVNQNSFCSGLHWSN